MLLLAGAVFWIGTRVRLVVLSIAAAVPGLLFATYYLHLFDGWAWFYNFRALPYSDLAASGLGLGAGTIHRWIGGKLLAPVALLVVLFVPYAKPLLSRVDLSKLSTERTGEVCLQSTFSTCGPASAAALLRSFGIAASERELAEEALTSRTGTEIWHLSRALRRRGVNSTALVRSDGQILAPSIAGVLLRGNSGHFVAVLSAADDGVTIMDPMYGVFKLTRAEAAKKYRFTGFFLTLAVRE